MTSNELVQDPFVACVCIYIYIHTRVHHVVGRLELWLEWLSDEILLCETFPEKMEMRLLFEAATEDYLCKKVT